MNKKVVIKGYAICILLFLNVILPMFFPFNQSMLSSNAVLGSSTDNELYSSLYSDFELWGRYLEIEQTGGGRDDSFSDDWKEVENRIKENDLYTKSSAIKGLANKVFNSENSTDFVENLHALDIYVGKCVDEGNCIHDYSDGDNDDSDGGNDNSGGTPSEEAPSRFSGMVDIFAKILQYVYPIAGIISVIFLIIGGYMWMTSVGDPIKIKQAQGTLTWAVIGLVFTLLSFGILKVIVMFLE